MQFTAISERVSPTLSPRPLSAHIPQAADELTTLHLAPDDESEVKIESHVGAAGCQYIFLLFHPNIL